MSTQRDVVIARASRIFPYRAERVFDAWLDPRLARQWLFATPDGEMVRAEIEPHVGGRFVFTDHRNGEDVAHTGEYLEIDRPRRLVFTFAVSGIGTSPDLVRVDIIPHADGCELRLEHEMGAGYNEYVERTEQGWAMMLASLDMSLHPVTQRRRNADHEISCPVQAS